jgi:hypothetical protein
VARGALAAGLALGLVSGWSLPAWPAGDVTVVLVNGHLRIRGDAESNLISLVSEAPGEITVGNLTRKVRSTEDRAVRGARSRGGHVHRRRG